METNEEKDEVACDHLMPDPLTGRPSSALDWGYIFCPKCRKRL